MECNKDEATRAIAIAEGKFEKKDYTGAKKFALKAQSLYPKLEGISQLLATLDVYISSEIKINGEVDYYTVFNINPLSDEETVRKQYKKMVLLLHPDKNKSIGADGAFKIISEAWSFLSDKAKRLAYNQRRNLKAYPQHKGPTHSTGGPSVPPRGNGFNNNFTSKTVPVQRTPKSNSVPSWAPPKPAPVPQRKKIETFWTNCHICKMHYEYPKIYVNQTLLCQSCHEPFYAAETPPPIGFSSSSNIQTPGNRSSDPQRNAPPPQQQYRGSYPPPPGNSSLDPQRKPTPQGGSFAPPPGNSSLDPQRNAKKTEQVVPPPHGRSNVSYAGFKRDPPPRSSDIDQDPSIAEKAANVVQLARERMRKEHEAKNVGIIKEEAPFKKSRVGDGVFHQFGANNTGNPYQPFMGINNNNNNNGFESAFASGSSNIGGFGSAFASGSSSIGGFEASRAHGFPGTNVKPNIVKELSPFELRKSLIEKGRSEVLKNLRDFKSKSANKTAENTEKEKLPSVNGNDTKATNESTDSKKSSQPNIPELAPISVPDPDFHDFDVERTEDCFGENEVWAAYDDLDGMPRFYALISKVITRKPFKVKMSWLNSKTTNEFSSIDWVGSGFYKTCGEFRIGKHELNKSINSFSHKVSWTKGPRGSVLIFPQKGEIWALYRNWSADWDVKTCSEVIHKYEMVLVMDDYNEEEGVSVSPLVKVDGFRTVFRQHVGPENIRKIKKEEMFRFSHRVPNYLLTGEEGENAPKGCQELDPAASPIEV